MVWFVVDFVALLTLYFGFAVAGCLLCCLGFGVCLLSFGCCRDRFVCEVFVARGAWLVC